ncbi:hypothetical protein [Diplocloster agilis]|uniref:hypothetical protein n=1 Tax=Diplocloster agilis TaxID=2850323 RepID=UPI000822D5D4|nr:hypothetical protein [Suonthocola fibrivorans]MCU6735292.1 hypothetical protein [Suonthocola fibrivorans]SCJ69851.1 Uncharacterised protein [uncultured Clostridium sp.]
MRKWCLALAILMTCVFTAGCSAKLSDLNEDTVYIQKKGQITGVIVEDFTKQYYDAEELQDMLNQEITDYNTESGRECVTLQSYEVKDGIVRVLIDYVDADCYGKFNGVDFFAGLYPGIEEYDLPDTMIKVKDNSSVSMAEVQSEAEEKGYHATVVSEKTDVKVTSKILYISENMELVDKTTARVVVDETDENKDTKELAFIIYK